VAHLQLMKKNFSSLPKNWHNYISYVAQNISLIDDTLERNIALAINDKHIDRNKIMEVIKLSKLNKFSQSSYTNSVLGENGLQVSGREKQRIGITKALLRQKNFYI
jgi:ATP-binding cassette, subfamily B, bacterial PglK